MPERGPAPPLALGRDAQARFRGAVGALLDAPGLEGASDAVRLAVIVLASRTPSETGVVEIRTPELGRWLGLSASYVASDVVPALRRSGLVSIDTAEGEFGQDIGLECRVLPVWDAYGVVGHPLALEKKEFATLLRLLEAVMAPGWAHKDGRVTPAGLLGARVGRAAATDRLALLLLVLEARENGQVRQCGGTVDTKRGRAAATLARLMGCKASTGERVLERLEDRDLVQRVRVGTASKLAHRTRLIVPAVAAAHGKRGAADLRQEDRATAPNPDFSEPDVAAGGSEAFESEEESQVSGVPVADEAGVTEPDVTAALHTDHSPVGTDVSSLALSGGFSGEGRGGSGDLPDRACEREDQAVDADAVDRLRLVDGEGGPLRGEQPKKSPSSISENGDCGPVAGAPVRVVDGAGQDRQQQGRGVLPPENLRVILEPVRLLWARLERPAARRLVEAAARAELATVSGFVGRIDGPQVLADRLARRLEDQLRLGGPIKDPVGWLIGKGLPQRQECGDALCDDRMLLDSGRDCPRCDDRQASSRAQRHAVAAAVETAMPYASEAERRTATERQLHETVTAQAWAREHRWEQVRARQAAAAKHRAEAAAARPAIDEPASPPAPVVLPAPRPAPAAPEPEVDVDQELVLEDLTREQVLDWRTRAAKDHEIVFAHIDRYGEVSARRLFTGRFVDQVTRLSSLGHLNLGYTPWGQA
ncbi:hypothetical protein QA995_42950 [Streptomyces scabiei]|uniref:hypothetical protein n=1 Tax=Streptomyces scabiei TaxID=1930 RepID=UPI0029AD144A|nr:hypothetical protein [Streptomyces scabiei]MDX2871565.1 hypothetical protein [Streptomyces scabiei]MDX3449305.1 hypothetical protein [Streptomyces scabiei]MDX3463259.1 hypothetical protein [Streptomyces scabiei]